MIHAAGWVSLGRDPRGLSRAINVDATRGLLDDAQRASVERFVLTSTLHTLAAGTSTSPADETSPWNLECVDSPYARSKREAEALVRRASQGTFTTVVLCPGMVLGPRDPKPTSTRLLHVLARSPRGVSPAGRNPDRRCEGPCSGPSQSPHGGSTRRAVCRRRPLPELRRARRARGGDHGKTPDRRPPAGSARAAAEGRRQPARAPWPSHRIVRHDRRGRVSPTSTSPGTAPMLASAWCIHLPWKRSEPPWPPRPAPNQAAHVDLSKPTHGVGPRCVISVGTT